MPISPNDNSMKLIMENWNSFKAKEKSTDLILNENLFKILNWLKPKTPKPKPKQRIGFKASPGPRKGDVGVTEPIRRKTGKGKRTKKTKSTVRHGDRDFPALGGKHPHASDVARFAPRPKQVVEVAQEAGLTAEKIGAMRRALEFFSKTPTIAKNMAGYTGIGFLFSVGFQGGVALLQTLFDAGDEPPAGQDGKVALAQALQQYDIEVVDDPPTPEEKETGKRLADTVDAVVQAEYVLKLTMMNWRTKCADPELSGLNDSEKKACAQMRDLGAPAPEEEIKAILNQLEANLQSIQKGGAVAPPKIQKPKPAEQSDPPEAPSEESQYDYEPAPDED